MNLFKHYLHSGIFNGNNLKIFDLGFGPLTFGRFFALKKKIYFSKIISGKSVYKNTTRNCQRTTTFEKRVSLRKKYIKPATNSLKIVTFCKKKNTFGQIV